MTLTLHSHPEDILRRGAWLCVWFGACAAIFATLAGQTTDSPYRVEGFAEPARSLAMHAWTLAAITLAVLAHVSTSTQNRSVFAGKRGWVLTSFWCLGAALSLGAMAYAARTGVLGVQLRDTGQRGHGVLVSRWAGNAMLLVALAGTWPLLKSTSDLSDKTS
ncbi:MAG: hypothetical protein Q8Q09_18935 [Deltaproteobacteria bacterium]|nr:hypothetical protein [Deltaproteobacteria bacterium]